jgi:hypothetical protein
MKEENLLDKLNMSEDDEEDFDDEESEEEHSSLSKEELNEMLTRKRLSKLH